jgi:hypothetical protein
MSPSKPSGGKGEERIRLAPDPYAGHLPVARPACRSSWSPLFRPTGHWVGRPLSPPPLLVLPFVASIFGESPKVSEGSLNRCRVKLESVRELAELVVTPGSQHVVA